MGTLTLTDVAVHVAGYDFTTDANEASLTPEVDDLDTTTFGGGGYRTRIGGVKNIEAELSGFWQSATSGAVDPEVFPSLATLNEVVSVAPNNTEANPCYLFQAGKFNYEILGGHGEVAPFTLSMMGTDGTAGLVRGQLAKKKGNVSATGALGSVLNLGAPTSTQYVYASFHVFTAGTTITVQVQSDDSAGFATPTTRATIGPLTATGGTWMARVAGPFAGETHWRFNVSSITGTFNVAGAIGVQ